MNYIIYENNLHKYRKQKSISQEELAIAIGSCRSTISNIERGLQEPSIRMAQRIATYLAVGLDEVFPII